VNPLTSRAYIPAHAIIANNYLKILAMLLDRVILFAVAYINSDVILAETCTLGWFSQLE
jgi:hypothetical protein